MVVERQCVVKFGEDELVWDGEIAEKREDVLIAGFDAYSCVYKEDNPSKPEKKRKPMSVNARIAVRSL